MQLVTEHARKRLETRYRIYGVRDIQKIADALINPLNHKLIYISADHSEIRRTTYKKRSIYGIIRNGRIITFIPEKNVHHQGYKEKLISDLRKELLDSKSYCGMLKQRISSEQVNSEYTEVVNAKTFFDAVSALVEIWRGKDGTE
jgi:hypothetical protein